MITLTKNYCIATIERCEWETISPDILESLCIAMQLLHDNDMHERAADLLTLTKTLSSTNTAGHIIDLLNDLEEQDDIETLCDLAAQEDTDPAQASIQWDSETEDTETLDLVQRAKELHEKVKSLRAEERAKVEDPFG